MTSPTPFNSDGFRIAWDSTSAKAFMTCPRKFQFEMIEGWRLPSTSVHLRFGGIYASALEHYHKCMAAGAHREEAIRASVSLALVESWDHDLDADGQRLPGTGAPWQSDHDKKNRETLIRTIVWYFDEFEEEEASTVILANGKPAVELSFKLQIENDLIFCGHIDRMIEVHGSIYVQDQKTTSGYINESYRRGFSVDFQMTGYSLAAKTLWAVPVKGVVIDAARILVGSSHFERFITQRTDAMIEDGLRLLKHLVKLEHQCAETGYYPPNYSACGNYGGCPFISVCNKPEHLRRNFLRAEFVQQEPWNPMVER